MPNLVVCALIVRNENYALCATQRVHGLAVEVGVSQRKVLSRLSKISLY